MLFSHISRSDAVLREEDMPDVLARLKNLIGEKTLNSEHCLKISFERYQYWLENRSAYAVPPWAVELATNAHNFFYFYDKLEDNNERSNLAKRMRDPVAANSFFYEFRVAVHFLMYSKSVRWISPLLKNMPDLEVECNSGQKVLAGC